jgi:hypothetical protein
MKKPKKPIKPGLLDENRNVVETKIICSIEGELGVHLLSEDEMDAIAKEKSGLTDEEWEDEPVSMYEYICTMSRLSADNLQEVLSICKVKKWNLVEL